MLAWKKRGAAAPTQTIQTLTQPAAEPSALLAFIAADFAGEIATLWPAPHARFLTASTSRRHLICLALAQAAQYAVQPGPAFVAPGLELPFKQALRVLVPGAPSGLARALALLGERAWGAADYLSLLRLLERPAAAKVLRHADEIALRTVRVLAALPDAMIEAGGELLRLTEAQTLLLAESYEALVRRDGSERAGVAAQRWAQARTVQALFRKAREDVKPAACAPAHPPAGKLVALSTRQALADAGRRYRNCLESRFLDGANHYYEWRGEPGVVICVTSDPLHGWRLDEALAAGNQAVPDLAQAEIIATLRHMGVHVGRSAWHMDHLLRKAADPTFQIRGLDDVIGEVFGQD